MSVEFCKYAQTIGKVIWCLSALPELSSLCVKLTKADETHYFLYEDIMYAAEKTLTILGWRKSFCLAKMFGYERNEVKGNEIS